MLFLNMQNQKRKEILYNDMKKQQRNDFSFDSSSNTKRMFQGERS